MFDYIQSEVFSCYANLKVKDNHENTEEEKYDFVESIKYQFSFRFEPPKH